MTIGVTPGTRMQRALAAVERFASERRGCGLVACWLVMVLEMLNGIQPAGVVVEAGGRVRFVQTAGFLLVDWGLDAAEWKALQLPLGTCIADLNDIGAVRPGSTSDDDDGELEHAQRVRLACSLLMALRENEQVIRA